MLKNMTLIPGDRFHYEGELYTFLYSEISLVVKYSEQYENGKIDSIDEILYLMDQNGARVSIPGNMLEQFLFNSTYSPKEEKPNVL